MASLEEKKMSSFTSKLKKALEEKDKVRLEAYENYMKTVEEDPKVTVDEVIILNFKYAIRSFNDTDICVIDPGTYDKKELTEAVSDLIYDWSSAENKEIRIEVKWAFQGKDDQLIPVLDKAYMVDDKFNERVTADIVSYLWYQMKVLVLMKNPPLEIFD